MNALDQRIDTILENENLTDDERALQINAIEDYKESNQRQKLIDHK